MITYQVFGWASGASTTTGVTEAAVAALYYL